MSAPSTEGNPATPLTFIKSVRAVLPLIGKRWLICGVAIALSLGLVELYFATNLKTIAQKFLFSDANGDQQPGSLIHAALLLVGLGVLRLVLDGLSSYIEALQMQSFGANHRLKLFKVAILSPNQDHSNTIGLFGDEISRAMASLPLLVPATVHSILSVLLCLLLLQTSPLLFMGMVVASLLLLIPSYLVNKSILKSGHRTTVVWSKVNTDLIAILKHRLFLRIHGLHREAFERVGWELENIKKINLAAARVEAVKTRSPQAAALLVVFWFLVLSGSTDAIRVETVPMFVYLAIRFGQSMSKVSLSVSRFAVSVPIFLKLNRSIEDQSKDLLERNDAPSNPSARLKSVEVCNLTIVGRNGDLLDNVSLKVAVGSPVIIRGRTGLGKSTLIQAIAAGGSPSIRFVFPDGSIASCLDGSSIAYVSDQPFYLRGTIAENLLFGNPRRDSITANDIWDALKLCHLYDDVKNLEGQLDFTISDAGELSSGQFQRLSLARAILRDPQLLLLDEATANLNAEVETSIYRSLESFLRSRVTIIVTHTLNPQVLSVFDVLNLEDFVPEAASARLATG